MTDEGGLPVSLFDTRIGELVPLEGKALLRWSDDAEARWGLNSPVVSRNLRVSHSGVEQTESGETDHG